MQNVTAARTSLRHLMQKLMLLERQCNGTCRQPLDFLAVCTQLHRSRDLRPSRGIVVTNAVRDSSIVPDLLEHGHLGDQNGSSVEPVLAGSPQTSGACEPAERHLAVTSHPEPAHSDVVTAANLRTAAASKHRKGARGRPWTSLHARMQQSLTSSKLLDAESVLVAVSGGQDSVCLLQALVDLQPVWRWRLGVVHCDHGWRTDSAANAEFVREMAERRYGLRCHVRVAPPGAVPSERAARDWRYQVFAEVAAAHGYGVVVTGHTATDRAETMLLNLLRGSGPDGLVALARSRPLGPVTSAAAQTTRGSDPCRSSAASNGSGHAAAATAGEDAQEAPGCVPPAPDVRLVRPLLEFSRTETQEFVETLGLPYFHDTTNDCNDLRRNRLRNEVLPSLRLGFNPRLDQALFRFVEVLSAEMDYLEHVTDELYDNVVSYNLGDGVQGTALSGGGSGTTNGVAGRSRSGRGGGSSTGGGGGVGGDARGCAPCSAAALQEVDFSSGAALQLSQLRTLPLAMQRRVVRKWLELALGGTHGSRPAGGSDASAGEGPGQTSGRQHSSQVRYEDVARCLALLHAPNRTNSDSLCAGLVASVRDGHLVLMRRGERAPVQTGERAPVRSALLRTQPTQQRQQNHGQHQHEHEREQQLHSDRDRLHS